jgi:hypothetical protein
LEVRVSVGVHHAYVTKITPQPRDCPEGDRTISAQNQRKRAGLYRDLNSWPKGLNRGQYSREISRSGALLVRLIELGAIVAHINDVIAYGLKFGNETCFAKRGGRAFTSRREGGGADRRAEQCDSILLADDFDRHSSSPSPHDPV